MDDSDLPPIGITIQARSVYGQTKYYPVCQYSKTFCKLLGQTTLTVQDLKHILALGYKITYFQDRSMELAHA